MTRIYSATHIGKPVGQVFEYVSTPGNWPQWHPSSLGVSGVTDRSLQMGEQVTEEFRVAGRHGHAVWTVTEREAPRRWVIEGQIAGRDSGGTVSYTLTPRDGGTFFEREFVYPTRGLLFTLLNWLFIRHRVQGESDEAARRLKAVLEREE
ncbi:MAG TPA: SRPBCC family protein [Anaerolineae bacterium]